MSEKQAREVKKAHEEKYRTLTITREEVMQAVDPDIIRLIIYNILKKANFDIEREITRKHQDNFRIMFEQEKEAPVIEVVEPKNLKGELK